MGDQYAFASDQQLALNIVGELVVHEFHRDDEETEPMRLDRFTVGPIVPVKWGVAALETMHLVKIYEKVQLPQYCSVGELFWSTARRHTAVVGNAEWKILTRWEQDRVTEVFNTIANDESVKEALKSAFLELVVTSQAAVDKIHRCQEPYKRTMKVGEPKYGEKGQLSGDYRADLLPPLALLQIAELLKKGAERHEDEDPSNPKWKSTPVREHVNRAFTHILGHLAGDGQEEHLLHAACRLLFALECSALPSGDETSQSGGK